MIRGSLISLLSLSLLSLTYSQVSEDAQVRTIIGQSIYDNGLIYNGHFTTNPAISLGPTGYTWQEYDNPTSPDREKHKGIIKFNGTSTSWADMSLSTGPNSLGMALPLFGGASLGTGDRQGVTFEITIRFEAWNNWAKIFTIGDSGTRINEIQWTCDGDSDAFNRLLFQQYINPATVGLNFDKGLFETFRPQLGEWYHLALVLKPVTLDTTNRLYGGGTWYLYINGQQIALSGAIVPGAAFVQSQAANYPLRLARGDQYLAKSKYSDPLGQFSLDAIRIYDVALTAGEISQLANIYGLNLSTSALPTPALDKTFPSMPENTKHRTTSINFDPIYRLDFATNPASLVGGTTDYSWVNVDSSDTLADQAAHTGLARFATDTQWINLMAETGPKSAGKVIPTMFSTTSGTGSAYGYTIDLVFKPTAMTNWAKLWSIGTTAAQDTFYTGWRGADNLLEACNYNVLRDDLLNTPNPACTSYYRAPTLNKWSHLAWVVEPLDKSGVQPLTNYNASWALYYNGELVAKTPFTMNMPTPTVRRQAKLGGSIWPNDPTARMFVDAFRIWDRALNGTQVEELAAAYSVTPVDGGDYAWQQALGTARAPVYNLDFQANPTQNGQGPLNWQWMEQDPTDTTIVAGQHTGLAVLDGSANSWISLNSATGPNRVYDGLVMPAVGGPTNPGAGYTSGWSVEIVFKATGWGRWSKLFTLSNGADVDEIMVGFDEGGGNMVVQNYNDDAAYGGQWAYAVTEILAPTNIGQWYHLVATFRSGSVAGAGNWQIFINGQLQEWASRITPGMTFTELQGASYPRAVTRDRSQIGKSNFNDPNMRAIYDAFRIYDYVLTPAQVSSFATAYGCNTPLNIATPANNQPLPATSETSNWQLAGITAPPVFNAVFGQDPASYVGGRTDYRWLEYDPTDSASLQTRHRGILLFNGTDGAFADLTKATGPTSIGLVLPILGGAGSGIGSSRGITLEMVVKLLAPKTWAKIFQYSSGPQSDSIAFGWNNDRYGTIEMHNINAVRAGLTQTGAVDIMQQGPIGRWFHMACSLRLTDDTRYDGSWTCYVDGEIVARKESTDSVNPANFPLPVYRQNSFLAKSAWSNDPNAEMMLDMVRVYDYALTDAQVRASANQYFIDQGPPTNTTLTFPDTDESTAVRAIYGSKPPVFNAWFGTNPVPTVSTPSPLAYTWLQSDSSDSSADQLKHRGVVKFTGAATSFIDVNTNIGPNSCGVVLPWIGGLGSGTGDSVGWSFEIVFKVTRMNGWAKLFDFGNGPDVGNIVLGVEGSDLSTMYVDVFDRDQTQFPHGLAEAFTPQLNKWYHVVWQIAPANVTAGSAIYYLYVNGQRLAYTDALAPGSAFTPIQGAAFPKRFYRRNAYLAKSNWADPTFEGSIDALRIYDYLLPADQITRLADYYGCLDNSAVIPTPALNKAVNPSTAAEVRAWDREGIVEPVFNANFAIDPRPLVGGSTRYSWVETDSTDTAANQAVHKGLLSLDGTAQSYIDLMSAEGPNSIGLILPTLFAPGSGTRNEKGWTIELVAKLRVRNTWSKLVNFATGGSDWMDSLAITWNGRQAADGLIAVHNYNNLNPVPTSPLEEGIVNFHKPDLDTWYHITIVMQPTKPLEKTGAVWRMYIDGTLKNRTQSNQPTHNQVGNYPLAVVRGNSFIGASQWGLGNDPNQNMLVDALRIYDRALLPTQVAALARMYGYTPNVVPEPDMQDWINDVPSSTGPAGPSSTGPTGSSSSSSSSLGGGAIAGIVIGAVVGAALLFAAIFCICCGSLGRAGKKASSNEGAGKYGEMEPSEQSSHHQEVEMEETA